MKGTFLCLLGRLQFMMLMSLHSGKRLGWKNCVEAETNVCVCVWVISLFACVGGNSVSVKISELTRGDRVQSQFMMPVSLFPSVI